jgi:tRNA 2-thiouridine synthesizing protein A
MTKTVNARGLSCPQPVIMARKAITEGIFPIELLVETATSRDNVCRMAEKSGCTVNVAIVADDEFKLTIEKADQGVTAKM